MNDLMRFYRAAVETKDLNKLKEMVVKNAALAAIYPESIHEKNGAVLFLQKVNGSKKLIALGEDSDIYQELQGTENREAENRYKTCDLTVENSKVIRRHFPFTNPVSLKGYDITVGLGDRLGLASPGHLRLIKNYQIRPVLAQQSMRELTLTGRSYDQVLADAVWAVFQEDYQNGYGADGDHLKTLPDIKNALDMGYTMITLDCSDYIYNLSGEDANAVAELYSRIERQKRQSLEERFLGKVFQTGDLRISFTPEALNRNAVIYQKAIDYAIKVYHDLIQPAGEIDFEVSIDETGTPTEPSAHFFVAQQLIEAGVKIYSLAPRFCGEFQKGIDYRGDLNRFETEYKIHEQIARHFGYKISIHSGSDKFSLFSVIGRESRRLHLKTAGTNWLEAVRVIIHKAPDLYRRIHTFALEHLAEAKKYYHISADPGRIPPIQALSDQDLPVLMNHDDARQVIHITYGLILQARDEKGRGLFREEIYDCLRRNEDYYAQCLIRHLGRHLRELGLREDI